MKLHKSIKRIPLTKKAYEEYQAEHDRLEVEKEEIMARVVKARAMGDLSGKWRLQVWQILN